MHLGNVAGPLLGSGVSAVMGFRGVFIITALLVLMKTLHIAWRFRQIPTKP